jgi:uncharacterized protein YdhG (YjbR/CyaY superfamily)
MTKGKIKNVDEYINAAPEYAQKKLREIRSVLKKVAPKATEMLKWGVPIYEEKRILFSFSAHKAHLNFMPTGPSMKPFLAELKEYKKGKDTIQFPYDKPLPKKLIEKIAKFRYQDVKENDAKWMY